MTKDEVIAWFRTTTNDLAPMVASMPPATQPASRPAPDASMMLASIRLPVVLVEQLDHLAASQGVRRSDVIRDALSAYVVDRAASGAGTKLSRSLLDILRRVVADRATR